MALKGIKVIEMLGLAPGPFCGTILADFGASVTVVQKINDSPFDVMSNGKRNISIDLKTKEGLMVIKKICKASDIILDTFRPGVMEKIGLGPEILLKENAGLIYARLSGYGQDGYYKNKAGHDINYLGVSGVLSMLSQKGNPPSPPINILADFAGGSLICTLGIILALLERTKSGKGQIIDASMTEGAAYVATWLFKSRTLPIWSGEPGTNPLDGGSSFYKTYKTKDGKYMAVGALEPKFYKNLLIGLQLAENEFPQFGEKSLQEEKFKEIFSSKTQKEWCQVFDKLDACVTPVVDFDSVDKHDCNLSRKTFYRNSENLLQPNPAPKLSRTPGKSVGAQPSPVPGQHTIEILKELEYKNHDITELIEKGYVYASKKCNL